MVIKDNKLMITSNNKKITTMDISELNGIKSIEFNRVASIDKFLIVKDVKPVDKTSKTEESKATEKKALSQKEKKIYEEIKVENEPTNFFDKKNKEKSDPVNMEK